MDNKIIDQLEAAYSEELTLVADDLGALEEAVKAKMQPCRVCNLFAHAE